MACDATAHVMVGAFDRPPRSETDFGIRPYYRELWQCVTCGHIANRHSVDLAAIYSGTYRQTVYGAEFTSTFERVMALPRAKSDNRQRVQRIQNYFAERSLSPTHTVLDVGSGLGVFVAAMREAGWRCTAIDPDPVAVEHAQRHVGVAARCGDFLVMPIEGTFDLVAFNKVLEHVIPITEMLARASGYLAAGGRVYVEVPDGELAIKDAAEGPGREELTVDHYCAFSAASLALLARRSGFCAETIERVREPSGKYTLRAFLVPFV